MTYAINLDNRTTDGDRINTVYLRNAPEGADKIIRIREDLMVNGWQGRPVILIDCGDHHMALTGSHRLAAIAGLDTAIEALVLSDLTEEQFDLIDSANDDDDLLAALIEAGLTDAAEIMQAEVDSNNA